MTQDVQQCTDPTSRKNQKPAVEGDVSQIVNTSKSNYYIITMKTTFVLSFASMTAFASAAIGNRMGPIKGGESSTNLRGLLGNHPSHWNFKQCTERKILIAGEDLYNSLYSFYSFDVLGGAIPGPEDFASYNLPLLEPGPFLDNQGQREIVGYVQERLSYLPSGDFQDEFGYPDCTGNDVWTFYEGEKVSGQVTDSYTCFGFDELSILGGNGEYECSEGVIEKIDITDDFYDGSGYVIWNIVNCGRCDKRDRN